MNYRLSIEGTPDSVPGGTAVLLFHPSTGGTDPLDTGFLDTNDERFLVISTRTTAREVQQKLAHYDVDVSRAEILDTLSVERGYFRRNTDDLHYVSSPDDVAGILAITERFLDRHAGKRRLSFDSLSELAYYADDETAAETFEQIVGLLEEYDAIGLFHVSPEVHDPETLDRFRRASSARIKIDRDGSITTDF